MAAFFYVPSMRFIRILIQQIPCRFVMIERKCCTNPVDRTKMVKINTIWKCNEQHWIVIIFIQRYLGDATSSTLQFLLFEIEIWRSQSSTRNSVETSIFVCTILKAYTHTINKQSDYDRFLSLRFWVRDSLYRWNASRLSEDFSWSTENCIEIDDGVELCKFAVEDGVSYIGRRAEWMHYGWMSAFFGAGVRFMSQN